VGYEFEWDAGKAATNARRHGVDFDEARTATRMAPFARSVLTSTK
jgi:uncharacterized DUF497 family protein